MSMKKIPEKHEDEFSEGRAEKETVPEICTGRGLYVGRGKMGMKKKWKSNNRGQTWRARRNGP